MKQHIKNRTRSFCQSDQDVTRLFKKTKCYNRTIKVNAMHQSKKSKDEIKNSGCLSEDTRDSIHPNSSNPRGECYANAAQKNMDKKCQGKSKNDKVDGKAAPIGKDDVSMTSNYFPWKLWTLCPLCLQSQMTYLHSCAWICIRRSTNQMLVSEIYSSSCCRNGF
jgi:hypothetical protein